MFVMWMPVSNSGTFLFNTETGTMGVEGAEKLMFTSFCHKQKWSNAGLLKKNLENEQNHFKSVQRLKFRIKRVCISSFALY